MLHLILPDDSKYGKLETVWLALISHFSDLPIDRDNLRTRVTRGCNLIKSPDKIDEQDIRQYDAIAISDEFPKKNIVNIVFENVPKDIPVFLIVEEFTPVSDDCGAIVVQIKK